MTRPEDAPSLQGLQGRLDASDLSAGEGPISLPPLPDLNADLGLGGAVAESSAERFLNKDGSFSARRQQRGLQSINLYGELLTVSWGRFFVLLALAYLSINAVFAGCYFLIGPGALSDLPARNLDRFLACFFFSVQTFGTIGFGHVYPKSVAADWVVTVEAFIGLLGVALSTGILFARFSRPSHRVLFSDVAVVAPYHGGQALMFRITNGHRTQLIDLGTEVTFSHYEQLRADAAPGQPRRVRRFYPLPLERSRVIFFPTSWTVVHPINHDSPLWEQDSASLMADDAELLVVLRATDDASQQPIHARSSYKADEIIWNARFQPIHSLDAHGHLQVDVARLSETEPLPEALPRPQASPEPPPKPV